MSSQTHIVYTLHCDGDDCEEQYEDHWDNVYFADDSDARSHAERAGWRTYEGRDWCKTCKIGPHPFRGDREQVCRTCGIHLSDHENPDRIPIILPGQIPLIGVR